MHSCCVLGCTNRRPSGGRLKFYRLPTAYRPFQANRRCLWMKVLQKVNGGAGEFRENARICGAHFVSGEPSMDKDNPDFVPSVFRNAKNSPRPTDPSRRIFKGRPKRQRHHRNADEESEGTPSEDVALAFEQPSIQSAESEPPQDTLTADCATEEQTLTEQTKSDTETEETPSSPLDRAASSLASLDKISPVVLLKHVVAPSGDFLCELCNENFSTVGHLVQHKHRHENQTSPSHQVEGKIPVRVSAEREEPSLPCNICDRTFTDRHSLKRHKLLHVKDGRKCQTCGVLFCRLHRRTLLVAQPAAETACGDPDESEEDALEPGEVAEHVEDFETSWQFIPLLNYSIIKISEARHTEPETVPETPLPPLFLPGRPEAEPSRRADPEPQKVVHSESLPESCPYPHQKLPPALRMFSPQSLTSVFFQVERNYDYIFSKGADVPSESRVGKETAGTAARPRADGPKPEPQAREPTAFDMQIVL
ncbi:zinc finger protein 579-like isoform X1 [Syngnathoides biaculeatus]|uniref:zinc finger protein 579-like isoform X1 n=1 Tax=Syngnathoides biaculeatus TaxID=300417 RepID=UPI002ADE117E|nr:zinc finger protein 579-like isoform X1 [Syngnathoides biaculeatus]